MECHFYQYSKYNTSRLHPKYYKVIWGKKKVLNESTLKEIRLPKEGKLLGMVIKLFGSDQVLVKCTNDITKRKRIRGKLKRRIWISGNDVVILDPWDFKQTERGDII